jgi:hypothetical protein
MRNVSNTFRAMLILLALNVSYPVYATPPKTLKSANGLIFMTGGIGSDEALEMRSYAKKFTLNLLFSEGTVGRLAADINVNIYDVHNHMVFRIKGAKPMLYVNLPAGTYTVLANNNGLKLRHKLTIDGNTNQKVILNWKDEVDEDALTNEGENAD